MKRRNFLAALFAPLVARLAPKPKVTEIRTMTAVRIMESPTFHEHALVLEWPMPSPDLAAFVKGLEIANRQLTELSGIYEAQLGLTA